MRGRDIVINNKNVSKYDISVVIPTAKAPSVFKECLAALFKGTIQPREVILVDDGMDSRAIEISGLFPVKIVKNMYKGVSGARNTGAKVAESQIILFIDTDVIVQKETLEKIQETFESDKVDGVVGIQTTNLRFKNFSSVYKNHWMRFTYERLKSPIHLFYTSCAAIKKSEFLKSEGFDLNYERPSIEDTVFGATLGELGIYISANPDVEVEHVKYYNISSILKTDFVRSSDLMKYVLRTSNWKNTQRVKKTSVPNNFIFSAILMTLFYFFSFIFFLVKWNIGGECAIACLVGVYLFNYQWLKYLFKKEGFLFGIKSILFLPLDVTIVIIGIFKGFFDYFSGKLY